MHGFTLDPACGEFFCPTRTSRSRIWVQTYSVNEGNTEIWDDEQKKLVLFLKDKDPETKRPYKLRYIGTLVADFHRTLLKGGIFMYPRDRKNREGKLRFAFEGAPMAFIVENAGGMAFHGRTEDSRCHARDDPPVRATVHRQPQKYGAGDAAPFRQRARERENILTERVKKQLSCRAAFPGCAVRFERDTHRTWQIKPNQAQPRATPIPDEIRSIKGVKDILPDEVGKWQWVEKIAREVFFRYGFKEIRPPVFEKTGLFARSIGETTDIVEKEMYTFTDRGGEQVTLRPEGTASVVRAYIEHKLYNPPSVVKLYYFGPMFRYERPQAGRFRQFYQIGVEAMGADNPMVDVEVMTLLVELFRRLGLDGLELQINSLGCPECRPQYREVLQAAIRRHLSELCANCNQRYERNPLRVLDCKVERDREIARGLPKTQDHLCETCRGNFTAVQNLPERCGRGVFHQPAAGARAGLLFAHDVRGGLGRSGSAKCFVRRWPLRFAGGRVRWTTHALFRVRAGHGSVCCR